jgi:hypothetical protein
MLALRREHRERGAAAYADALSRLWLGNGAGALAALSAMGAAASARLHLHKWFIMCPGAFVLGLVLLGIGTLVTLVHEARWLNAHEEADGLLDLRVAFIQRPTHEMGLAWLNPRTLLAVGSAIAYLVGVIAGSAAVLQALPV